MEMTDFFIVKRGDKFAIKGHYNTFFNRLFGRTEKYVGINWGEGGYCGYYNPQDAYWTTEKECRLMVEKFNKHSKKIVLSPNEERIT